MYILKNIANAGTMVLVIICSILIFTSTASAQELHVSCSRYSIFAPWENKAGEASLSANFTAYALLLDNNGKPISGESITFKIYSPASNATLKVTRNNTTQQNGLASIPYDTYADFTSQTDTDYGTWRIDAYLTSNPAVISSTNMRIEGGGCNKGNCHETDTVSGAKPLSPYTEQYGQVNTRAAAAHKKTNHQNAGCPACHPGYASDKTATGTDGKTYGKTADVHSSRTCEFCHGNWSYITDTGNGIPIMPSCYQCHPVLNSNVLSISTLANLAAGNGISVYSYNYDLEKPLAAHNGTMYSLTDSVPCISCHGPAHNNSKPYFGSGSNSVTENEQCWNCHTNRATTHKSNTNCVGCHSQDAHNVTTISAGGPDCKSCHDIGGIAPKHVNFTDMNSTGAIHKKLNNAASATVNPENKKCWACHGDGTEPGGHPSNYKTPRVCIDCHASGTYKVDNHRQGGVNISTAASCANCHNNSIIRFEASENASVSHYGTKANLADTKDCRYCHKNAVNGAMWGSATDPWNSPTFPHSLSTTTNEECYSCHGSIGGGDFHDTVLQKQTLSSVTCLDCHKLGTNMSRTKIDQNVRSSAVHKDEACTGCHIGASTANMNTYSIAGDAPKSCTLCHTDVLEHQQSGQDIKTTISCRDCHNNDDMYAANAGTNGTQNAVVHYLENITNTATIPYEHFGPIDTSNCILCHNGQYTGDPAWGTPVNISTSSKRQHTETTPAECDNCHKDSGVSTLANVDFHNAAIKLGAGQGPNCLDCHAGDE